MTKKPFEKFLMNKKDEGDGGGGTGDQTNQNANDEQDSSDAQGDDQSTDELGALKLSEEQKSYIEKLRKENAKWRNKSKASNAEMTKLQERLSKLEGGLKKVVGADDEDEVDPETQIQALSAKAQKIEFEKTLSDLAIEHGIGKETFRYFKFVVNEALEALDEGEELDEDAIAELAIQAKRFGTSKGTGSSVGTKGPGATQETGAVTFEKFVKMSIQEKSALYGKSPELYNRLMSEAKEKRALI